MELSDYRVQIDKLDKEIKKNIEERMRVVEGIAKYKTEHNIPITDGIREGELLDKISDEAPEDLEHYERMLFTAIFEMSKDHQRAVSGLESPLVKKIRAALKETPKEFPQKAVVACQGVQGAYSEAAAKRMFKQPRIMFTKNFRGVIKAVESGLCQYGILPIENSTAGSVNQVYDLMNEYHVYIVKGVKMKIDHSLLVKPGVKKEDIRTVISHGQGLAQCDDYIQTLGEGRIETKEVENTAVAAQMVAESDRRDIAAISSEKCADLYGLEALEQSVNDEGSNYTRFVCIAKDLEIYPGADRTSLKFKTRHQPGALYRVLAPFNALGINIVKLESRPIPNSDFDFMFYFDIEETVYSEEFVRLIGELEGMTDLTYFGSYSE